MTKKEMIQKITNVIKETHNEQDVKDLQNMSQIELKEIMFDLYFGEEFMVKANKGEVSKWKA
tara:strand:- start:258 stop:443 length:186 start_codon:yes stop_codon:yes gene_type:complete